MSEEKKKLKVSEREEEILKFWTENKIFEKSLEKTKDGTPFTFYDGPPFATGTPHYGHLVASAMKDAIPRYQTMRGRFVERQWGWDTHGLPIENIVEKELGVKSKKEIEEIGIGKFNNLCREKLFTYVDEWNKFIPRFGRWADMTNPYVTMDPKYMESEWWAFKSLFDKNLIYKDYRSMHICPRCETTLAQAEVAEGYKDVKDIAVTAKFELLNPDRLPITRNENSKVYILAWTTTPWTLPGNVALAVGSDIEYLVLIKNSNEFYITSRRAFIQNGDDYKDMMIMSLQGKDIILKGEELIGLEYKPLFSYYSDDENLENRENGWKIYGADFVTTESGTGVVHIAPAFGEDDMNLGKEKNLPFVQHVGMDGVIKPEVKKLAGLSVKPKDDPQATDVAVLKLLAERDLIFSKEKYEHSYPHCWRCDTPLLNYATSSWFVSVTKIKKELLEYAKEINWSPRHIKEGRWLNWLEGARDWSISRQRFWANTIPVWENEKTGERLVIGSVEELKKHTKKSGNKYFVMRHGESEGNTKGVWSSDPDKNDPLTEKGKEQVLNSAKNFKNQDIDIIVSSPVMRTKMTAEIVAEVVGFSKDKIVYDSRIREIEVGEKYQGKPLEDFLNIFPTHRDRYLEDNPDGESYTDAKTRVMETLYEYEEKYSGKNILFVTHGACVAGFLIGSQGLSPKEIEDAEDSHYVKNAEIRELDFTPLPHNDLYELDLHRPYIDEIELLDGQGEPLKRTTDVLDTWFDSGSVPFSSYHYPFENEHKVKNRIPADFIAEGVDQVSKWFYYQHVLSTALFDGSIFKNVIANGIVLAEDGKKMAKRLQNYPDPIDIVEKYGADALRLYLLTSPVMRAENMNFSEDGVGELYKKVIMRLENVLSFYELFSSGNEEGKPSYKNVLDRWIVARLHTLSNEVTKAMENYELDRATRPIVDFIDDLSTWYVRRSRDRFKGSDENDKNDAILTTRYVLLELSKLLAPFTPFIAENLYQKVGREKESVHLEDWHQEDVADSKLLEDMSTVRKVISSALEARVSSGFKVRQPLASLKLQASSLKLQEELVGLIKDEVNVKEVLFDNSMENEVELDTNITPELQAEGNARDLIRHIQSMRKNAGLKPEDEVSAIVSSSENLSFMETYRDLIMSVCGLIELSEGDVDEGEDLKIEENTVRVSIS